MQSSSYMYMPGWGVLWPLVAYVGLAIPCVSESPLPLVLHGFDRPPASFHRALDAYRNPLLFDDGTRVVSVEDWSRRREEILDAWMRLMGPWPELLKEGRLEPGNAEQKDGYRQQRVRLRIAPDQRAEGWLLLPDGEGPFPSVLVVYYDPETSIGLKADKPGRDFGRQLVRKGLATLNIGTPGGDAWKPELGEARCQPLSFHAYVAANAWFAMAAHPSLDPRRIGIAGHSYGGKWAMFAGAMWDRFAAVAVSDPGIVFDETRPDVNYWEPWYLGLDPDLQRPRVGIPSVDNPRTGAYRTMIERGMDLHEIHALMAPRPFLVSGGSEDSLERWHALDHLLHVNRLLGSEQRVFFTQRKGHGPTPASNEQLNAFFEHFLKP
jgi:hypothetical protein